MKLVKCEAYDPHSFFLRYFYSNEKGLKNSGLNRFNHLQLKNMTEAHLINNQVARFQDIVYTVDSLILSDYYRILDS